MQQQCISHSLSQMLLLHVACFLLLVAVAAVAVAIAVALTAGATTAAVARAAAAANNALIFNIVIAVTNRAATVASGEGE